MAGYRRAPFVARPRGSWQRKRRAFSTSLIGRTAEDSWTFGDYNWPAGNYTIAHTVAYQKTATDGWSISESAVGANPSAGTATAGLIFLFSQGTAGSAYTRSATDGWTISDSAGGSYSPVATNSYSRSTTDGFVIVDAASGSYAVGTSTPGLIGIDLDFTSVLDVELVLIGE